MEDPGAVSRVIGGTAHLVCVNTLPNKVMLAPSYDCGNKFL